MAGAAAKRVASQNETAVRNLRLGLLLPTLISLLLRLFFRRSSLPPSKTSAFVYLLFSLPGFFLSKYLVKIGSTKRDPTTKTVISSGEDLNQPGVTEWCFDIVYITYLCQVGSGAFGDKVWWFYAIIPGYAFFKIFNNFISPYFFGGSTASAEDVAQEPATSKRQEKLKKRSERGQQTRVRVR